MFFRTSLAWVSVCSVAASCAHGALVYLPVTQNAVISYGEPDQVFLDAGVLSVSSFTYPVRVLLQADLSSIPEDAQITSASLHLFIQGTDTSPIAVDRAVNDSWLQSSVTWRNYYASGSQSLVDTASPASSNAYTSWSLDSLDFSQDLADKSLTLVLRQANEGDGYYRQSTMYSRLTPNINNLSGLADSEIRPYLELTYAVPEPAAIGLLAPASLVLCRRRSRRIGTGR